MPQPDLWLARHGQTDWSASGRHTGRTDIPLNANGRAAAEVLATKLAGEHFDLVLTSPLERARDTCSLAGFGDATELEPNLREWDYGDYEGITSDEIRQTRPGWTVFNGGCPGGETIDEVGDRLDHVIARVREQDGRAIAFGHGHALRILAARWVGLPPSDGALLTLDTATLSVLSWEREVAVIHRWNSG